jgi:outer membrane protein insertion porin family
VDLDVQVKEKPTGSFSFGAGYSSEEKVMGMASINQANLLGMGYQLSLDASLSSVRKTYSLTFNNPRLFDSDYFGGFDIYKSFRQYSDFDKRSTGFSLTTGTSINDQWSIRLAYGYDDSFVHNVSTTASSLVKAQAGAIITSSITPSISYDTRDNPWDAHRGQNAKLSAQLAGWILGGTAEFIRLDLDEKLYFPFLWQTVFTVRGRVGYIVGLESQEVPIYERYALGGISSLRGYGYRSVGPVDSASGEVIGGDKQFILNLEYVFPLIPEAKVNGVAFFDAGEAWDVGQRYFDTALFKSTGMGVRWISPMGPLRLEYGWPLDRRPGERGGKWEFSVGGFF